MKGFIRTSLRASFKNWPTLLLFEILYKSVGFILFTELAYYVQMGVLRVLDVPYISQENIQLVFRNPLTIAMAVGACLIIAFYLYLEIITLMVYCEAGWDRGYISLPALCKKSFKASLNVFTLRNLPFTLVLLPVIGLSNIPLAYGLAARLNIPEFIIDYIKSSHPLFILFILLTLCINIFLLFSLFSIPNVIFARNHYVQSFQESIRLLKGKILKTALALFVNIALFVLLILGIFAVIILAIWLLSKDSATLFQLYYIKWVAMAINVFNILMSLSVCATAITLYHSYREDQPAPAPHPKSKKAFLYRLGLFMASLLLLAFYSETEVGAKFAYPANQDTAIVAHRAGATFAPENTLAALSHSIAADADMAEIDIQQTRDGVLIIMHDSDFQRTTGYSQKVWDTDYATVRKLDAGSAFSARFAGEHIPTLHDMLARAKNKIQLMIEIKITGHERDIVAQTVAEIQNAQMEGQCMIASMRLDVLEAAKALDPRIKTVYITTFLISDLYDLGFVDGFSVESSFLDASIIENAHAYGKEIYVWTINSDNAIRKYLASGVDGIITDNPDLARYYLSAGDRANVLEWLTDMLYS